MKKELITQAIAAVKKSAKKAAAELMSDVGSHTKEKLTEKLKSLSDEATTAAQEKAAGMLGLRSSTTSTPPAPEKKTADAPSGEGAGSQKPAVVTTIEPAPSKPCVVVSEDMTEEEEDKFIQNVSTRITGVALSAIKNPAQAAEVLNNLVDAAKEVNKFQEVQITKRASIESLRQQALAKIDAQKALLMTFLTRTFDERAEIFQQQFRVIDDALATGNIQQLALGLDSVSKLAASSPFKDLSSIASVGKALDDKNTVWDF